MVQIYCPLLKKSYYNYMVGFIDAASAKLVWMGENIEDGIKSRRLNYIKTSERKIVGWKWHEGEW